MDAQLPLTQSDFDGTRTADQRPEQQKSATQMWSHLRLTKLRAEFRAERGCRLPEYKGATLRGALGFALKEVACVGRGSDDACQQCRFPGECAYGAFFEPPARNGGSQVVPYILSAPASRQQQFQPGETLEMGITLVGSACKWVPWVAAALERMGQRGMGWGRAPWALTALSYEGPVGTRFALNGSQPQCAELSGSEIAAAQPLGDAVTIEFLTPTQLKERKDGRRFADEVTGELLVRRLLRRLGDLLECYCDWPAAGFRYQPLLDAAGRIRCVAQRLHVRHWERYSTRQEQRHALPGFVGTMQLADVPAELRPYLAIGAWTHVGKSASFGMGQYRIGNSPSGGS